MRAHYELLAPLGGGTGVVDKAREPSLTAWSLKFSRPAR